MTVPEKGARNGGTGIVAGLTHRDGGERHVAGARIMAGAGVTVGGTGRPGAVPARVRRPIRAANPRRDRKTTPNGRERDMPRLDLGAVRATFRTVLRRLDSWTLSTMNSPPGAPRPPL